MSVDDYFEYEAAIARDHLLPWLRAEGALPEDGRVLDVGCGYGGTLAALKQQTPGVFAVGLDRDPVMVAAGRARVGNAVDIQQADFFEWSAAAFDLILMRDVLEHIREPERALVRAASLLRPGGWLFASFAPFFGPFGGHQHNGAGLFSAVPWLQVLPTAALRSLLRIEGNSYKAKRELAEDMASVLETRLTVRGFVRAAAAARLNVVAQKCFFSRPDYRIKFGLPTVPLPRFAAEVLATGVEALARKP